MKHAPYMSSNEMTELMWLSAVRQIFERVIKTTQDKAWLRYLKTADTYTNKVIDERWKNLEALEQTKAMRRIRGLGIKVYSYDDARVDKDDDGRKYTIGQDDFLDLIDAASLNCYGCPQGEVVKDCPRRKMFHRLGLQVHALREAPAPGECEFRYDNEQRAVTPQYKALPEACIEQLP